MTHNSAVSETYTYDAVGNRLTSLTVPSLSYNSSNELVSTSKSSYAYDYNGNLTSKTNTTGTTGFTWDYENRLTSVTLPGSGGTVTFKYDPFGRRIQKSGPAGTTNYLYDGANAVTDVNASGAVVASYTQGSGIDEPLSSITAVGTAFFEADGLGSITSLSGASGVTDTYTYKPFGITAATGSNPNRFRFTGRESDQETGLYYYRARYYDPNTGRFVSDDPIGFSGSINFYSYVSNNPVFFSDPTGLAPTCEDKKRCPPKWKQKVYNAAIHLLLPELAGAGAIPKLGHGGVFQVGVGGAKSFGSAKLWPNWMPALGAASGSATLAFDQYGNIGLVISGSGVGNALGVGSVGGVQLATSPAADNIFQLEGWSMTGGIGGGTGAGGALEYSWGSTPGGTFTETIGVGAGGFAPAGLYGYTRVVPRVCP